MRSKVLTRQVVVRFKQAEYDKLAVEAQVNGRTISQEVRFRIRHAYAMGIGQVGVKK